MSLVGRTTTFVLTGMPVQKTLIYISLKSRITSTFKVQDMFLKFDFPEVSFLNKPGNFFKTKTGFILNIHSKTYSTKLGDFLTIIYHEN